ncbi:hypothetical protein T05_9708 [Trichinella murrelli]|uniref:Uncharacterized protein n=1 Tax=Trichinella murrelli TaxID=144512 RepID=A0A0V0TEJ8_9BILA|nr:hypothetical protein T05_9708 [Trichinella murrelli]
MPFLHLSSGNSVKPCPVHLHHLRSVVNRITYPYNNRSAIYAPPVPSPSPISFYIPAVHLSDYAFIVVYGPSAFPTSIHIESFSYYSMLRLHSISPLFPPETRLAPIHCCTSAHHILNAQSQRRMLYPLSIFHLSDIPLTAAVHDKSGSERNCIKNGSNISKSVAFSVEPRSKMPFVI